MYVVITAGDTLRSLAIKYLGSAAAATTLIAANNLDAPYVSDSLSFVRFNPSTGTVMFTLNGNGPVTIPAGTVVSTTPGPSGEVRSYQTATVITLNSTGNTATTQATCTVAGPLGNVMPYRVTVLAGFSSVSVTNTTSMSGGFALNVLMPGDEIYVPTASSAYGQNVVPVVSDQTIAQKNENGGIGILVTPNGDIQFGPNDLMLANGSTEISQELVCRLRTRKGDLFYNPQSGSLLPSLIGTASTSFDLAAQVVIFAQADVKQDSRVSSASFKATPINNTWLDVVGTVVLKSGIEQSVQFSL